MGTPILFCNIGWMNRYEGLTGKPDKIVGGGKFVTENETGLEVCNFLACRDGYVYGHVETGQGTKERKIWIEAIGGSGEYVDGMDVVWTATDPDEGGRKIIGWYRDARSIVNGESSPPFLLGSMYATRLTTTGSSRWRRMQFALT
jgi:hypothetical protein